MTTQSGIRCLRKTSWPFAPSDLRSIAISNKMETVGLPNNMLQPTGAP
jgi:hypothetical protein